MKISDVGLSLIKLFEGCKLEAYKVPKRIEQIDKIPRTYNGKLQRKKLIEAEKEKAETQGK